MDILEMLSRALAQLAGRADGPLNFRLVVMPTVVTMLAIRAGLRDAREGRRHFLWMVIFDSEKRPHLMRSAAGDVGRVFLIGILLDTIYQVMVIKWVYPPQVVIVAVACAVVPYLVVRGPVSVLAGLRSKAQAH